MSSDFGDIFAQGGNAGQPPKYTSKEEIEEKMQEYFNTCGWSYIEGKEDPVFNSPKLTGLALYLGFCSRQSLYDYEKRAEFSYSIKKARTMIEMHHEEGAGGKTPTGHIFMLKNMGWSDSTKVESTNLNINTDLTDEERKNSLDKIKKATDDFKDY